MDVLLCVGVIADDACVYCVECQKRKPAFIEVYGHGCIIEEVYGHDRKISIACMQAFDLRTGLADGRSWDFI